MKVEYINPFVVALSNAFNTMLGCAVRRGALSLKTDHSPQFDYSGVIGLSGNAVGSVVLSLSHSVAQQATAAMLMVDAEALKENEIVDAVGELANIVAGRAKANLEAYQLSISLPSVITGKSHHVRFPSNITPICVGFETAWGPLALEVGMAEVAVPSGA